MDKYLIRVAETGTFASTSLVLVEASTLDDAEEKALQLAKDSRLIKDCRCDDETIDEPIIFSDIERDELIHLR